MSAIQVQGLLPLKGEITVQGSKNAVLPIMAAAVLHKGKTLIKNVPGIQDVFCMKGILEILGCSCSFHGHELIIDARNLALSEIPREDMVKMRSSIVLMGPLLARCGEATAYYPGGCSIGKRPIDLHLLALRELGAQVEEEGEKITAKAARLKGNRITFTFPSVGATENALMAAVTAEGVTELHGCAMEPEIVELCHFLVNMGASIEGIGGSRLTVKGGMTLTDSEYQVGGDRIVAGTYLTAAMISMGDVAVRGAAVKNIGAELRRFRSMGADISVKDDETVCLRARERPLPGVIRTGPYPGFPTDLQSPVMAALSIADGDSQIEENIFEGRFKTGEELKKLGARITIDENRAYIRGRYPLVPGTVTATDLRGGAALIVAGMAAEGVTTVEHLCHVLRGYEDICGDLNSLGASLRQI